MAMRNGGGVNYVFWGPARGEVQLVLLLLPTGVAYERPPMRPARPR